MVRRTTSGALYWDASTVVSALLDDEHTAKARSFVKRPIPHLISTLTEAEVLAVLARGQRSALADSTPFEHARRALFAGPWVRTIDQPSRHVLHDMSTRWSLRGADLWHLALALHLNDELGATSLVTFDQRLLEAAQGEKLGVV